MPRKFDPDRHCGAPKKNGQPCTQPKGFGTNHVGTGKCHLHEEIRFVKEGEGKQAAIVASTKPPSTPRPDLLGNQYSRKHGMYSKVLTGKSKVRYEEAKTHHPSAILSDSFYLVHSRLLGFIEGDVKLGKQDQLVMDAAQILFENGDLTEDYLNLRLRPALSDMPLEKLAAIANSTIPMANAAVSLDRMGQMQAQNAMLMRFLQDVLRTGDKPLRELAIMTLERLKLETGLPVEEVRSALQVVYAVKDDDELLEVEEAIEVEAEEDGEEEG